jgi:hypothetical protein
VAAAQAQQQQMAAAMAAQGMGVQQAAVQQPGAMPAGRHT